MERAGKIIGKMRLKAVVAAGVKTYQLAPRAWTAAVGKTIAAHSRPAFLDGNTLIVEVDDVIWMSQLRSLEAQILSRIGKVVDAQMIQRIEFRIAPPRRRPGTASAPSRTGAHPVDEADSIEDPVLRRVYISSRRKETA
ncbi:MAG: DUF721 domain-containing protein [Candidatus Solibacter usitatus]|nr:DUF721 domain-containing protein [Candidatus Solibacter usitatus]